MEAQYLMSNMILKKFNKSFVLSDHCRGGISSNTEYFIYINVLIFEIAYKCNYNVNSLDCTTKKYQAAQFFITQSLSQYRAAIARRATSFTSTLSSRATLNTTACCNPVVCFTEKPVFLESETVLFLYLVSH